jgi:hypothetical protein
MAERKPFLLRLDPELYRAVRLWADDELRSVNGQIEFLLREAIKGAGRGPGSATRDPPPPPQGEGGGSPGS